jgi:Flp pilus assembly protein TadG
MRDIVLLSKAYKLIAYASTTELNFLTSASTNGTNSKGSKTPVTRTPAWSKLWSRDTNTQGIPSEVNVKYTYDREEKKITFYFPSIYVTSPPQQPSILSTYTKYVEQSAQVGSEDVY